MASRIPRPRIDTAGIARKSHLVKAVTDINLYLNYRSDKPQPAPEVIQASIEYINSFTHGGHNTGQWQATKRFFVNEWIPEQLAEIDRRYPAKSNGGKRTGAGRRKELDTSLVRIPLDIKPLMHELGRIYKTKPAKREAITRKLTAALKAVAR